ncbi:hypothetical protein H6504_05750 [Candidatus Woesearchaeota archaeon]|nr:hypothetical protein [Candidatus Woesearchaeota archaeon]
MSLDAFIKLNYERVVTKDAAQTIEGVLSDLRQGRTLGVYQLKGISKIAHSLIKAGDVTLIPHLAQLHGLHHEAVYRIKEGEIRHREPYMLDKLLAHLLSHAADIAFLNYDITEKVSWLGQSTSDAVEAAGMLELTDPSYAARTLSIARRASGRAFARDHEKYAEFGETSYVLGMKIPALLALAHRGQHVRAAYRKVMKFSYHAFDETGDTLWAERAIDAAAELLRKSTISEQKEITYLDELATFSSHVLATSADDRFRAIAAKYWLMSAELLEKPRHKVDRVGRVLDLMEGHNTKNNHHRHIYAKASLILGGNSIGLLSRMYLHEARSHLEHLKKGEPYPEVFADYHSSLLGLVSHDDSMQAHHENLIRNIREAAERFVDLDWYSMAYESIISLPRNGHRCYTLGMISIDAYKETGSAPWKERAVEHLSNAKMDLMISDRRLHIGLIKQIDNLLSRYR